LQGTVDLLFVYNHDDPVGDLIKLVRKYLTKEEADLLLSTYGITEKTTDLIPIWQFCGDYAYNLPVIRAAAAWPRPEQCFMYHFEIGNSFREGPPYRGMSTHLLDASYQFQNLNVNMSESDQKLAKHMAELWITFANGKDPWAPYGEKHNAMCITPDGFIVRTEEEDRKRDERRWDKWKVVMDIGVEKIWKIIGVYHAQFDIDEK
jgi:carboxylesterase type B